MRIQTNDDVILNQLHPRLAVLNLRFIRSNRVIWLERDLGKDGYESYGPFPTLEYTEWAVGEIEKYQAEVIQ